MENQQNTGETQVVQKKPFYKTWWFITIIVVVILLIINSSGDDKNQKETETKNVNQTNEQTKTDNKVVESNQESKPEASSNVSEFKKTMMDALKIGIEGYNSSKNASVYAVSQNYSQGTEEVEKAEKEYKEALAKLNGLTPPDEYKKMHELITNAIEKFNQSNNFIKNGIIRRDATSLNRAGELLDEGNALIVQAQKEFSKLNTK